ncbi:MAG: hypothetical protein EBY66_00515 [Candidatus Fonsibacter lacus]|nr:hypothetical protein [Candidatus Fonsibacter lacus]
MARKKQDSDTAVLDPIETDTEMSTEVLTPETEAAKSTKVKVGGERKVGQELLEYAQNNQGIPGDELAYGAGYYTKITDAETGETQTRIHKNEFFKALTEASTGLVIPSARRAYSSRKGRAPIVTIGKTGNCVVGARHSAIAGFEPGSKVQVAAEAGKIVLTALGEAEAAEVEADDDLDL